MKFLLAVIIIIFGTIHGIWAVMVSKDGKPARASYYLLWFIWATIALGMLYGR